ncbi:hypothetical protein JW868_02495 [Candidatus Woesearchaeota archaeon]|nr:hypothetical protein [Candidatus Woesearchaeota archaeon]
MGVKSTLKDCWTDKFKRFMILFLVLIGIILFAVEYGQAEPPVPVADTDMDVYFLHSPTCPHCNAQKEWLEEIKPHYPNINFVEIDITNPSKRDRIVKLYEQFGVPQDRWGSVPVAFIRDEYIIGFDNAEGIGRQIEDKLATCQALTCNVTEEQALFPIEGTENLISDIPETVDAGIFGEIKIQDFSLGALSIILGLVDGFNPCAMWVLVYLIGLIVGLKDRRRIWLLVGTFILASGILYYLFMTAWLNVFLLIGFFRPLTIIIGIFATGFALLNLREVFITKGPLACKVGDLESKKKTMDKMKHIVYAPMSIATMIGIIGLAFVVNSIEFVCSSAIPAVYTQVLSLANLPGWQYYIYILLYTFFFMLDDLIIFGLAAFAVNKAVGDRYAKHCKWIGGFIMLILGIVLLFFPGLLH